MQVGFLNFYGAVLNLRQERSDLIANNIANADTPNYKAVDVPFNTALAGALGAQPSASSGPEYRQDGVVGLNGNDVSLDSERVEAAQNGQELQASTVFLHQATTDLVTALRPNPSGN
ncbi:MAG: flagellar biosynthesis protein FlgB [Proteobacteria bacterium]|nr:flagellar biosynthesis protein FlgB [Pseudomonadota bacterium]MBU6425441.1 flagellar biosynthesis protein FlgB [Rhodospirillales bacterium]